MPFINLGSILAPNAEASGVGVTGSGQLKETLCNLTPPTWSLNSFTFSSGIAEYLIFFNVDKSLHGW